MKRLHRTALSCCLSFLRFVMFLNLSSVKVYAAEVSPDVSDGWYLFPFNDVALSTHVTGTFNDVQGVYHASGNLGNGSYFNFSDNNSGGVFPFVESGRRYLLFYNITAVADFNFKRVILRSEIDDSSSSNALYVSAQGHQLSNSRTFVNNTTTVSGIIDFVSNKTFQFSTGSAILVELDSSISSSGRVDWAFYIKDITDNTAHEVNQIIAAINNQTSSLSGAIGSAADQVTDKIDEVLTPEGENNLGEYVDQITDQIDDNLGALGFAHDTVENFIGLFNEEPPAPVITVPPLKMKINGVEHQFFNGYEYDIRTLEAGPLNFLIQAVRFACSGILWWAFLSYCFDEFDELFRGS